MAGFADKLKAGFSKLSKVVDTDGVKDTNAANYPHVYDVSVEGMKCEHCSGRIVAVLNKLENVMAEADLAEKKVVIRTKTELNAEFIKETIAKIGDFVDTAINKVK